VSATIKIDYSELSKAMLEYSVACKKTFAETTNRACGNMALRAAQFVAKAVKGAVASMWQKEWWPKYISRVLKTTGFTLHGRRKARGEERNATWIDTATGKVMHGRKSIGTNRDVGMGQSTSLKDRLRVSKRIIARRVATVGSFKAVFSWVAAKFIPDKVTKIGGKNFWRVATKMAKERDTNPYAEFIIPFKVDRKNLPTNDSQCASGKERIGYAALQKGINFVAQDMMAYAQKQLMAHGRKHSGT
jgi:hypothetical protein